MTLLRRFEPVVRYTQGEKFLPMPVDEYVKRCSLWLREERKEDRQLVPAGELTLEQLATYREVAAGQSLHMRFIQKPLTPAEFQRWLSSPDRPRFRMGGRLSRVGLLPRIIDGGIDATLLVRGNVPGGTAAAAAVKYGQILKDDPRISYYGRVIRQGGWLALHYNFFFAMNDWRSSFAGVNDHEADWEQVFIFVAEEDGELTPRWVAYSSHDYKGDDLRRRWDDPDLEIVDGMHPVVYAGVGSHASYFERGEYLMGAAPSFLAPVTKAIDAGRSFWYGTLGQGGGSDSLEPASAFVSIPYLDYGRGDGVSVGPGQDREWSPGALGRGPSACCPHLC